MSQTMSYCPKCKKLNNVDSKQAMEKAAKCGHCGETLPMHSLVSEVDGAAMKRIVAKSNKPVVVDFWASWCGPCKVYAPEFERASVELENAIFLKVNTELDPTIAQHMGIRGIPTTIVFNQGQEFTRKTGALSTEIIRQLLPS